MASGNMGVYIHVCVSSGKRENVLFYCGLWWKEYDKHPGGSLVLLTPIYPFLEYVAQSSLLRITPVNETAIPMCYVVQ